MAKYYSIEHTTAEHCGQTCKDAPKAVFPEATTFLRKVIPSTADLKEKIKLRMGKTPTSMWQDSYVTFVAMKGEAVLGYAVIVDEIGKHRPITFVVGIGADHKIKDVALMVYREAYGGEVRDRRFLQQYRGKELKDPLLPFRDVQNISGATLSVEAIGQGQQSPGAGRVGLLRSIGSQVKTTLFFVFLLIVAFTPFRTAAAPREVREVHYQMGTFLEITLWHPDAETAKRLVRDAVTEVHRLDEILSNYDPDSALSRLNRHAGAGPMPVPAELFEVLARACEFSARTSGIFDITIGSLMELWRKAEEKLLPKQMQLREALAAVGYRHLALHADQAELLHKGTQIDLGGIGKGYAVDATIWVFQFQRIGVSYDHVVTYYLGGEIGGQLFFAKNLNALLEETHFHAFTMSVVFLIVAHLFWPPRCLGALSCFSS